MIIGNQFEDLTNNQNGIVKLEENLEKTKEGDTKLRKIELISTIDKKIKI